MPFAEPQTGLISTIEETYEENYKHEGGTRPAAAQTGSTTFQQLTRIVNNLQIMSITYGQLAFCY